MEKEECQTEVIVQQHSSEGAPAPGNNTGKSGPLPPSSGERLMKERRLDTLATLLRKRKGTGKNMNETERNDFSSAKTGQPEIVNSNEKPSASAMLEKSAAFSQSGIEDSKPRSLNDNENSPERLPLVKPDLNSNAQMPTLEMVGSPSMNLLDESAQHIFGLMKGLHANQPPAEVRAFDPDRVNAAVACSNSIYKIMRLKLDAIKVQQKIRESK